VGYPTRRPELSYHQQLEALLGLGCSFEGWNVELLKAPVATRQLHNLVFGDSAARFERTGRSNPAAENRTAARELDAIFGWTGADPRPLLACGRLAAGAIGKLDRGKTDNKAS